jgi:ankyrin repeat protein
MINFIKTLIFTGLLIANACYALPNNDEFKRMCQFKDRYSQIITLEKVLNETTAALFLNWMHDFNDFLNSPLAYAVSAGNIPIIKLLIDFCIKEGIPYDNFITTSGVSLLSIAVMCKHTKVVCLLLDDYQHPVTMDNLAENKTSALHQAAINGDIYTCKLLINTGKDLIHCKDYKELTPINYLMDTANQEFIIELLDKYPVNKNNIPLDSLGQSYLHHAVKNKLCQIVEKLLDMNFDPSKKNHKGETPIYLAINQCENIALQQMLSKAKEQNNSCMSLNCLRFLSRNKQRRHSGSLAKFHYNKKHGYDYVR